MSNFTDFFSAGGASGQGKTVTVGDYSYPGATKISDCEIYRVSTSSTSTAQAYVEASAIQSASHPEVYNGWDNSSDFNTVANITSASNGGALYGVLAYKHSTGYPAGQHTNRQVVMKITLDGTATTFTSRQSTSGSYEFSWLEGIGETNIIHQGPTSGRGSVILPAHFGPTETNSSPDAWGWDSGTSSWYKEHGTSSSYLNEIMFQTNESFNRGCRYLHFENTCKVEIKTGSGSSSHTNTRAWIKLF